MTNETLTYRGFTIEKHDAGNLTLPYYSVRELKDIFKNSYTTHSLSQAKRAISTALHGKLRNYFIFFRDFLITASRYQGHYDIYKPKGGYYTQAPSYTQAQHCINLYYYNQEKIKEEQND